MNPIITLGIETSCDETALALIETRRVDDIFECRILGSLIHSQADLHSAYGGVYPNLAKREHEHHLPILLDTLFEQARTTHSDATITKNIVDTIAVTEGPGLEPALWTGITFAEKLGKEWNIPVIPVNHMEGHIIGSLLRNDTPDGQWQRLHELPTPALALLVSGGHTELVTINPKGQVFSYNILGATKDDAVGEAFDKAARLLGLPYPGGPHLSRMAQEARDLDIPAPVTLPRPMIASKDLDFSFSGLKTAVLYAIRNAEKSGVLTDDFKKGLAREFEDAAIETLLSKLRKATDQISAKSIILGGGVSANTLLRERISSLAAEYDIPIYLPSKHISGDNALMIAVAGAFSGIPSKKLRAQGTKKIGS